MVNNMTPATTQITTEQILPSEQEGELRLAIHEITSSFELRGYHLSRRRVFEDLIGRFRSNKRIWVKYAKWEESKLNFSRARSIWERGLLVDYQDQTIWINYADFETRNNCFNHARNVWDRAIEILPSVNKIWYRYIHMEETLENVAGARKLFEQWMSLKPRENCWISYIKFEHRYKEVERARAIYERFVVCHPKVSVWTRFANFEIRNGDLNRARKCYERALRILGHTNEVGKLLLAFAKFERALGETRRARCIFEFAINQPPFNMPNMLFEEFIDFEKSQGEFERTRCLYEGFLILRNDLKVWIDYAKFEASVKGIELARAVFERALEYYRDCDTKSKNERETILEEWLKMESSFGVLGMRKYNTSGKRRRLLQMVHFTNCH